MRTAFFESVIAARYCMAMLLLLTVPATAEQPPRDSATLFDPSRFLDQFFGKENAADEAALAAIPISGKEEQELGERAAQAFLARLRRQDIRVVSRGKDVEYLRRLVTTVQPKMTRAGEYRDIKVYVALSDETDARSFPGGHLVFFRGLLDFVQSEATLISIVGHELSHLDRGHQLRSVRKMKLAQQSFQETRQLQHFISNGFNMMRLFARPFRPEDEADADRDGVRWAYELGYDPRELGHLFLQWQARDGNQGRVPAFFRTHPQHADRHAAVMHQYQQLQEEIPHNNLYIGKKNLRLRVSREQSVFAE